MRRIAVAIGALAVLAAGGVAYAQTTGDERIYACVNNGDGAMRQVAGADTPCPKNFHQISWAAEQPSAVALRTYRVTSPPTTIQPDTTGQAFARCLEGDLNTGGGFGVGFDPNVKISESHAVITSNSDGDAIQAWLVEARNPTDAARGLESFAVCLDMTP